MIPDLQENCKNQRRQHFVDATRSVYTIDSQQATARYIIKESLCPSAHVRGEC